MLTVTVNGVEYPLPLQTDALQDSLDRLYDSGRLSELVDPHAHLAAIQGDWPTPPFTDWPRPRLGSLYWPIVGLARYAFGCFLVDEYTLGQIRAGMIAADTNTVLLTFADDPLDTSAPILDELGNPLLDESGNPLFTETQTVPVSMRLLATRPLVRTTSDPLTTLNTAVLPTDAWVMLLVDSRYGLLHAEGALADVSWSSLFSAGSVSIADAVAGAYLTPGDRWTDERVAGRPRSWLLDVAAAEVGSRIVVVPGASPVLQRPTAGRAAVLAGQHLLSALDGRFLGGGPIEDADIDPGLPDTVKVVFDGTVVSVSGAGYGWPSGTHVTHWSDAGTETEASERTALTAQWAVDWEAWQRDQYDTTYSGFVEAPASGFLWAVEWYHDAGRGYTKFVRPPHWYGFLLAPSMADDELSTITETESLVNSTTFTTVGTYTRVVETVTVYTNYFTAAHRILDRTAGEPTERVSYIRACNNCCDDFDLVVDAEVAHTFGGTGLRSAVILTSGVVYFDGSATTGGSGGLTYEWFFDDPIASNYTEDSPDATGVTVSHAFSQAGPHMVLLVVSDGGGCNYGRFILPVYVVASQPECDCEANCPSGAPYAYTLDVHGGTEDFARYNGRWEIPLTNPDVHAVDEDTTCVYEGGVLDKGDAAFDPFGFAIQPFEPGHSCQITISRGTHPHPAEYEITQPDYETCCAPGEIDLAAIVVDPDLSGDSPLIDGPLPIGACGCGVVGECSDEESVMTFTVAGVTKNPSGDALCICTTMNGGYTLPWAGADWREEIVIPTDCFGNATRFTQITCSEDPGEVQLAFYYAADEMARYKLPTASWVSPGANVMVLDSSNSGNCDTWPATITVNAS